MLKIKLPIYRNYVVSHRELNFVYSNDYHNKGCLGMCWHFFGEPNTFAVPTCNKLCPSSSDKFFRDEAFERFKALIDERVALIPTDKPLIIVPKIGMGCSRMKEYGPKLYEYLIGRLNELKNTPIEWIYQ